MKEKPDNVADEPGLLPYGSNLSAPSFRPDDLTVFKKSGATRVVDHLSTKMLEIQKMYIDLMEEYSWNEEIYKSEYTFRPIQGNVYYLYRRPDGTTFLSILSAAESRFAEKWDYEILGSFLFCSNDNWVKQTDEK